MYYLRKEKLNTRFHCVKSTQKIWRVFIFFSTFVLDLHKVSRNSNNLNSNYYEYF